MFPCINHQKYGSLIIAVSWYIIFHLEMNEIGSFNLPRRVDGCWMSTSPNSSTQRCETGLLWPTNWAVLASATRSLDPTSRRRRWGARVPWLETKLSSFTCRASWQLWQEKPNQVPWQTSWISLGLSTKGHPRRASEFLELSPWFSFSFPSIPRSQIIQSAKEAPNRVLKKCCQFPKKSQTCVQSISVSSAFRSTSWIPSASEHCSTQPRPDSRVTRHPSSSMGRKRASGWRRFMEVFYMFLPRVLERTKWSDF